MDSFWDQTFPSKLIAPSLYIYRIRRIHRPSLHLQVIHQGGMVTAGITQDGLTQAAICFAIFLAGMALGIAFGFWGHSFSLSPCTPSPPQQTPAPAKEPTTTRANDQSTRDEWSYPRPYQLIKKPGYTALVNYKTRCPYWVLERLTPTSLAGRASRVSSTFRSDPEIPLQFQATPGDYRGSGYSRGHLAPAANHKSSQLDMNSTFMLGTNIVPQSLTHSECWARLEQWTRDLVLVQGFKDVLVLTGPIYWSEGDELVIQLMGDNKIHVPTHMFKAVLVDSRYFAAFVIPNQASVAIRGLPLNAYKVERRELEKMLGFKVFDKFDREKRLQDLSARTKVGVWPMMVTMGWENWMTEIRSWKKAQDGADCQV